MNDLPSRMTSLADALEKKAAIAAALADDHANNHEAAEEKRQRRRAENALEYAVDCRHAAKLLTTKAKQARFTPPTWQEVQSHIGHTHTEWPASDARAWYDHFESVGWKVNTKPMIDWKAAARNGFRNWREKNPQKNAAVTAHADPPGWMEFLESINRPYKAFALESAWVRADFKTKGRK